MFKFNLIKTVLLVSMVISSISTNAGQHQPKEEGIKTLVIILDALRKDYISESNTPNIYKLMNSGTVGQHHHSIFPTVTRVNSPSYATGSYPKTHGILGNTIYLPEVDSINGINTGDYQALNNADEIHKGKLLTTSSFGEAVAKSKNQRYMVFSTGTTGQTFLLNNKVKGAGIINPGLILPESKKDMVINDIGPIPDRQKPNLPRHTWVVDAFIHYVLEKDEADICTMWLSDPDGTAHAEGIGAPLTMQAIKGVDAEIGRILDKVQELGMQDRFNLIVSADHGFATHKGNPGLSDFLIDKGFKTSKKSDDVIVIDGGIYIKGGDQKKIEEIVQSLQKEEWVGAIFTQGVKKDDKKGAVAGTLSFASINWNHPERQAHILVDVNWTNETNEFGYEGFSYNRGKAGHGSSSPYEMQTPFIAVGPSFKKDFKNSNPSSMIDIMPTVLYIHGIEPIAKTDGRILNEILVGKNNSKDTKLKSTKEELEVKETFAWGEYQVKMFLSNYGDYQYMDYTKTTRILNKQSAER